MKRARWLTALLAVAIFTWVLVSAFREGVELPPNLWPRFLIAVPLSTLGLVAASLSWSVLVGGSPRANVAVFGTSLPLRHLPMGGLGQMAGLAGLSIAGGTARSRASQAAPVFLLTTAAGASIVAMPVVWDDSAPTLLRLGVGVAIVISALIVFRGPRVLAWMSKRWHLAAGAEDLPLGPSTAWSALAALGAGAAFTVLLQGPADLLAGVSGFSAAWLAGFLFVIAPAGIGAREAMLVALWPTVDPAVILAISLVHRVSTLVAEGVVLLVGLVLSRGLSPREAGEIS